MKKSIKEWDESQRPRERLMSLGPAALTNGELLGVLIGSGTADRSAVDIGQELLDHAGGNLNELGKLALSELRRFKGVGLARGVSIAAALELGRRRSAEQTVIPEQVVGSNDIASIFRPLLSDLPYEEVWVLLLTRSKRIIERYRLSQGGTQGAVIDVRLVVKRALDRGAAALVLAHNHPSGNAAPSDQDVANTSQLRLAASYFDIRLLDHVIVADSGIFSFAENGLL